MLLFKVEHIIPIILGIKTETRRDWKETYNKPIIGRNHQTKTKLIGKPYFCKIKILNLYQEILGNISYESAKREGYANQPAFLEAYFRINKISQKDRVIYIAKPTWVVRFRVVDGSIIWSRVEELTGVLREDIIAQQQDYLGAMNL